jgi:hypothetical protein
MGGWRRHLELAVQARIGLGSGVFIWAAVAIVCFLAMFGFLLLSAYVWLAQVWAPLPAALILTAAFFLIALIAAGCSIWLHHRIKRDAQLALATRKPVPWLDPMILGTAVSVGRSLGWRKTAPLLALCLLLTGAALQWTARNKSDSIDQ